MIFNLTEMQEKVLQVDNKVNIIACDRGAGATTGLLLKAMKNTREEPFTVMVFLSGYEAKQQFDKLKQMTVLGGWRFSEQSRIATNTDTGGKIKFCSSEFNVIPYGSTILMDCVHHIDKQVVDEVFKSEVKTYVTTNPPYCGQGINMWDSLLLKDETLFRMTEDFIYKFNIKEDYDPEIVSVVTGFGVQSNPYLSSEFKRTIRSIY